MLVVRGAKDLELKLGRAVENLRRGQLDAVKRATHMVESDLKRVGLTGRKHRHAFWGWQGAPASSHALGARTGAIRASVTSRVFTRGNAVVGVVGSPSRALRFHELGGTISGRPMLRIPTGAMLTAAGQDRLAGASARSLTGAFLWPNRRQRAGALAGRQLWIAIAGPGGRLVLLYLLKGSVTLPARHVFRETHRRMLRPIHDQFEAVTRLALRPVA